MRDVRWGFNPVVHAIDVGDGDARQLLLRDAGQATEVDAVHLSDGCLSSDTEWPNAASSAEEVKVLASIELVLRELGLAGQEAETLWGCHGRPEAVSAADGAVAAIRLLGKVEFGLELDRSAMATAAVRLKHRRTWRRGWGGAA